MRNDTSSSEGLAAMLASCSPTMFQGFEEAMVAGISQKRQFYSIFENSEEITADEDAADEYSHHVEKKRRLTADQVKSLEKNFEVENKLEPERKLHLARELGLQPRQVAVWFQNRRARWKTKQLEKDFDILKADYDALKGEYEAAIQEKEKLQAQVLRLNEKFRTGDSDQKLLRETSTLEQRENIFIESSLHMQNQMSNESAQSSLDSQMSPLPLPVRKRGSSSSNSDDSEVLDVESPPMEHPICSELANLGCADPPSLISIGEEDNEEVLPQIQTQRSIVKLEDETYPEESSNFLFSLEDPITGFSWWDWP